MNPNRNVEVVVTVDGVEQQKNMKGNGMVLLSFTFQEVNGRAAVNVEGGIVGSLDRQAVADGLIDIMDKFPGGQELLLASLIERIFLGKSPQAVPGQDEPRNVDEFLEQLLKKRRQE